MQATACLCTHATRGTSRISTQTSMACCMLSTQHEKIILGVWSLHLGANPCTTPWPYLQTPVYSRTRTTRSMRRSCWEGGFCQGPKNRLKTCLFIRCCHELGNDHLRAQGVGIADTLTGQQSTVQVVLRYKPFHTLKSTQVLPWAWR